MTRAPLAALAAVVVLGSLAMLAPWARGAGEPAEGLPFDTPVLVDVAGVQPVDAAALAAALPEWDEAIAAGTRRVTIPMGHYRALRAQGFNVRLVAAVTAPQAWPACYNTLDELYDWIGHAAAAHPDLIELYDIGDSFCKQRGGCTTPGGDVIAGRDLLVARLTNERATSAKHGRLWIDGGLHAREIPTTELVKAYISHLVDGYDRDAQVTFLLDHRELYAGIASNPDGRLLVELGTRAPYNGGPWYWRKNARSVGDACVWPPTGDSHYGVDLNRNHAFKWDIPTGGSFAPCDQTYRGLSAASEPEIVAYEQFIRSIFPDQRGPEDTDAAPPDTTGMLINFHNATDPGTVLLPWGWTTTPPPNDADLVAIARRYVADNGYQWLHALYPVNGNTRDWGYGELGIPSFVIELEGTDFFTPCDALPAVIDEHIDPLTLAFNVSDQPYTRIRGPEVLALDFSPAEESAAPILVRAQLGTGRSGGQSIAGAEVLLGQPGGAPVAWLPSPDREPGEGLAMRAVDGAFDGRAEEARLLLDARAIPEGRYYVVVRAADAEGHWGPPRAAFLDVPAAHTRLFFPRAERLMR